MGSPVVEQEPREKRDLVVGGSVNSAEESEILDAFRQAGFGTKSKAARVVCLCFSRSTKVRDAVAEYVRQNPMILAD